MYHFLFIILLLFSVFELFGKNNKIIENCSFIILLLVVAFRYGQGSDYFSYLQLFNLSANNFELSIKTLDLSYVTQEIGFSALSFFWIKILHLSPELLSSLFSTVSFILVWLFIKKYSLKPITSLFIFYCTFYLIYPYSVIRQSICISVFIYYLIPLLQKRKYVNYYLISLLLFTIHYSSIIFFIIPLVNLVRGYKISHVYFVSLIAFIVGLILYRVFFSFFSTVEIIGEKIGYYTGNVTFDILSLLLRVVVFVPISLNYNIYNRNSIRDLFLKIYILGFLLYLLFMSSSLISSRINVYMRYFEMILLVDFLLFFFRKKGNKIISYSYIIAIMTVLYVKNINSFIDQGPYFSHVNFFNYPYVSIFNKKTIIETRDIPFYYQEYLKYD